MKKLPGVDGTTFQAIYSRHANNDEGGEEVLQEARSGGQLQARLWIVNHIVLATSHVGCGNTRGFFSE